MTNEQLGMVFAEAFIKHGRDSPCAYLNKLWQVWQFSDIIHNSFANQFIKYRSNNMSETIICKGGKRKPEPFSLSAEDKLRIEKAQKENQESVFLDLGRSASAVVAMHSDRVRSLEMRLWRKDKQISSLRASLRELKARSVRINTHPELIRKVDKFRRELVRMRRRERMRNDT